MAAKCTKLYAYKSAYVAGQAAVLVAMRLHQPKMRTYRCQNPNCRRWHLTRKKKSGNDPR